MIIKFTWQLEDGWNKVHTSEILPTIDSIKFLAKRMDLKFFILQNLFCKSNLNQ
jgi:hypothetical protein